MQINGGYQSNLAGLLLAVQMLLLPPGTEIV